MSGYGGPDARQSPSLAPFLRRNSSGSIPIARQISSTTVSVANSEAVAPGARYADERGLLTSTSKPSMRTFLREYEAKTVMQPATMGDPGNAADSDAADASGEVI